MKVLDADKVIAALEEVKKLLPGKNGILPLKYFCKDNMEQLIQVLQEHTIDVPYVNESELIRVQQVSKEMTLAERLKTIKNIRDVLMASDAVSCDADFCEPVLYADTRLYHIPTGYSITVDYNKLAEAIYKAGFREEKPQ